MRKCLFAVAILNAMALITSPAGAADGKIFPGSLCHPDAEVFTNFHSGGGLFNSTGFQVPDDPADNFPQFFACPVVRDVTKGQADGILSARVHVVDNNATGDVFCTLSSRQKTSATVAPTTVEFASVSSSGTGNQRLDFPALDSGPRGYYFFLCEIPGMTASGFSGIWFYDVSEKE